MFVDASAIIAIITQEDDWESLAARLAQASKIYVSPMAVWEAVAGLAREARIPFEDAEALLDRFVEETKAQMITISAAIGREAVRASRLYGKGRHRASLNFGDCFAYACSKTHRLPLLFKGNDFVHTDITVA
jgi:ribonuclease VapC